MEAAENPPEDWRNWFHAHGPKLLLCARQWTRSAADAEDVVQDAFIRYWRRQRSLGGEPIALLLTSIRRAALDRARSERRRDQREQSAGAAETEPWFEPAPGNDERTQVLEAALRRLPEAQRDVVALKIWGELTFEQIGHQLAISPHTAASRYRYALESLRHDLSPAACHD
ncbi:MAG TPA: sigma-70 family RNA polymerase sigma factor [Opitutaceae bacterium]